MKTVQKTFNDFINENRFLIKTRYMVFGYSQGVLKNYIWVQPTYVKTHISQNKYLNTPLLISLTTLAHILNGYDMSEYHLISYFQYTRFKKWVLVLHIGFLL